MVLLIMHVIDSGFKKAQTEKLLWFEFKLLGHFYI